MWKTDSLGFPQLGQMFLTVSRQWTRCELIPLHPETCFVTKLRYVLGYFLMSLSMPRQWMRSNKSRFTIRLLWNNSLAVREPHHL